MLAGGGVAAKTKFGGGGELAVVGGGFPDRTEDCLRRAARDADPFAAAFARAVEKFAAEAWRGALQTLLVGMGCCGVLGLLPGFVA
ncbi:MAG: hypothetical protein B7Z37_11170 [Verrucomicrobia bacterium 12-59-8]|nr:MAG: hypothetical protein B7Z37_11170 [Verrucomicrobia bacterium 12-59-8]